MSVDSRTKFVYLSYDDITASIGNGVLDGYDMCITKDTHEFYIIKEDLTPFAIKSKVYVFDSVEEANTQLNENTDTYVGQIVAILCNDTYRGYIVNSVDGQFTVTPLWENSEQIDYNTLGNRPIVNLEGIVGNTIIVDELDNGIYNIKGQYKIDSSDITLNISANEILFMVEKSDDSIKIKQISHDNITDYLVLDGVITSDTYITSEYLSQCDYATKEYVDIKIAALQESINNDVQKYIADIVDEQLGTVLDEKIENSMSDFLLDHIAKEEDLNGLI